MDDDEVADAMRRAEAATGRAAATSAFETAWSDLRDDATRQEIVEHYGVRIGSLVVDAWKRGCPEAMADVLAWSLARIAVKSSNAAAMPEAVRVLSAHLVDLHSRKQAEEASARARNRHAGRR